MKKKEKDKFGYTDSQYKVFRKHAFIALIGFSVLYCFLYSGRLNLSAAMPVMMEENGWSAAQLGLLSSVFFWTYAIGHLFNGRLGEVIGVNRFIVAGVILSALTNILIGFQSSLIVITVLWGINGYFQSMAWAPGMSLLSKWWPGNTRGFATGFANGFSGFGQAVSTLSVMISFTVLPNLGWRAAFIFPVIVPILLSVVYALTVRETPSRVGLPDYKENSEKAAAEEEIAKVSESHGKIYPYIYLLKQWKFDIWLLIIAFANIARYGLLTWIPLYFTNVKGMDIKSGLMGSLLLPLGMGFGTIIIPALTDRFCANDRLPAVILCSLIGGVSVILFYFSQNSLIISILLFVAGFFLYAINGLVWAFALDAGGRSFAGTASGILDFVAYIGASVQAIIFGFSVDGGHWGMLFFTVTAICAAMALLSAASGIEKKVRLKRENAAAVLK